MSVTLALQELRNRALATGLLARRSASPSAASGRVAVITMAVAGKGTDATSNRALAALREEVLPATLERLPGVRASVTGSTAMSKDFNDAHEGARAVGLRVRALARLPAAAGDVPLARDPRSPRSC